MIVFYALLLYLSCQNQFFLLKQTFRFIHLTPHPPSSTRPQNILYLVWLVAVSLIIVVHAITWMNEQRKLSWLCRNSSQDIAFGKKKEWVKLNKSSGLGEYTQVYHLHTKSSRPEESVFYWKNILMDVKNWTYFPSFFSTCHFYNYIHEMTCLDENVWKSPKILTLFQFEHSFQIRASVCIFIA